LLADEMGLGKSIQSLSYLGIHKELRPALVICPASLKINWQREIKKWLNEESYILTGRKSTVIPDYPFYIINYDILASEIYVGKKKKLKDDSWIFKLGGLKLKMIIGDEIQAIANNKSIRTRGFVTLRKINKETKFIALSGTPIKNRPSEFFVVLNSLAPTIFPNRWKYLNEFCDPTHNGFGWQFNGASNIEKLNKLIQPIMLRRLKKDVLKDLPLKRKITNAGAAINIKIVLSTNSPTRVEPIVLVQSILPLVQIFILAKIYEFENTPKL
jgi:SWI/SNF-related matrix-associated actin-dependent regulator 1 of chromatin subfamily A